MNLIVLGQALIQHGLLTDFPPDFADLAAILPFGTVLEIASETALITAGNGHPFCC